MADTFVTSTASEGLEALGSSAQRSYELITDLVRARLSEAVAGLLAEPVSTARGGQIDWYAAPDGVPTPLSSLSAAEAEAVRADLDAGLRALTGLADRLAHEEGRDGPFLAEAVRNATAFPDVGSVWAVRRRDGGLSPVIVNWARARDGQVARRGDLTVTAPRREPPTPAVPPVPADPFPDVPPAPPSGATPAGLFGPTVAPAMPERPAAGQGGPGAAPGGGVRSSGRNWLLLLGWLALVLLIALILWLLLAPCGLRPGIVGACPGPAPDAAASAQQALLVEIASLEAALVERTRSCGEEATAP